MLPRECQLVALDARVRHAARVPLDSYRMCVGLVTRALAGAGVGWEGAPARTTAR